MLMEAQQAEIEFRDREMIVKEEELRLKTMKQEMEKMTIAKDAAIEMVRMGLDSDKTESEITRNYAEAIAKLVKDAGLDYAQARREVTSIEEDYIEGDINGRSVQALNGDPSRALAQ
jgi:hypothetical protein